METMTQEHSELNSNEHLESDWKKKITWVAN